MVGIDEGSLDLGDADGRSTKMRWYSTDSLRTRPDYIETPTDPPKVQRRTMKKAESIHNLNRTQNLDLSPTRESSGLRINELWLPQPEFPHDFVSVGSGNTQKNPMLVQADPQGRSSGIMANIFVSAKNLLGTSKDIAYITNTTTVQSLNDKDEFYPMDELNTIKMVASSGDIKMDESFVRTSL